MEERQVVTLLYTFILEYKGGTYVSQVHADNLCKAAVIWIQALPVGEIDGLTVAKRQEMEREIVDFAQKDFVPLDSCHNVWCFDVLTGKDFGIITTIATLE